MSDVREELARTLAASETAVRNGMDPQIFARSFYDDDLVAVVEGVDKATRGLPAFAARMEEFLRDLGPKPQVSFKLCDPILSSGSYAMGFIDARFHPDLAGAEDVQLRALMVWKRSEHGWRVTLEMYGAGSV